jgi:DNA polymerase-3 subunit epsilon
LAKGLPLLAYNAAYDLRILGAELARYGLASLEQRLGKPVDAVIDPLVIDRGLNRYRRGKRKLGDLVVVYGVPLSDSLHDALEDVRQSIAVFDIIEARYAQIAAMEAVDLHLWQQKQHRRWAENFNQWLQSRGQTADVDPQWP